MVEFSECRTLKAADKRKLSIASHFIQSYLASREGLKELGILRTERNLQGDYAEWIASVIMELKIVDNTVQKGYDATDSRGKRYQIKARIVRDLAQNTSFDFRKIESDFDYLVGIFLSPEIKPLGIIKVPQKVVAELSRKNETRLSFRWNKAKMSDKRIERVFWSGITK